MNFARSFEVLAAGVSTYVCTRPVVKNTDKEHSILEKEVGSQEIGVDVTNTALRLL